MTPATTPQQERRRQHGHDKGDVVSTLTTSGATRPAKPALSVARLNLMRVGYLLIGLGLAIVKWPLLPGAHDRPLYESVTISLLTAMSLLAFLGLRYPSTMLPVLLFEVSWKVLWLASVALPKGVQGDLDPATTDVLVSCSLVAVIIAVIPWRHVWRTYVMAPGEGWR